MLCPAELVAKMEKIIFRETSTLGIRRWQACRHKLDRRPHTVETPFGPIEGKLAVLPDGGDELFARIRSLPANRRREEPAAQGRL